MNVVSGILIMLLTLVISVGMQILVLINGWGMRPQSWWWILGVGFFGNVVLVTIGEIGKRIAKE